MLTWILERAVRRQERALGGSLDYLREILEVSPTAVVKAGLFGRHRKRLPRAARHLAVIVATREEDCGNCVQLAVNAAGKDGVPAPFIRAALEERLEYLPAALREVCEFARGVAEGWENPELREMLRARYGTEGIAELGMAVAGARIYPTLKRAMGYARRCSITPIAVTEEERKAARRGEETLAWKGGLHEQVLF